MDTFYCPFLNNYTLSNIYLVLLNTLVSLGVFRIKILLGNITKGMNKMIMIITHKAFFLCHQFNHRYINVIFSMVTMVTIDVTMVTHSEEHPLTI